jgi:hypothetical protein
MRKSQLKYNDEKFEEYPDIEIPKFIIRFNRKEMKGDKEYLYKGYAIHKHQKCKFKMFCDNKKTLLDNLGDAIKYISDLESEIIKPDIKEKLPKYIQRLNDGKKSGFRVVINKVVKKRFLSSKRTYDEKLQQAIEYIKNLEIN